HSIHTSNRPKASETSKSEVFASPTSIISGFSTVAQEPPTAESSTANTASTAPEALNNAPSIRKRVGIQDKEVPNTYTSQPQSKPRSSTLANLGIAPHPSKKLAKAPGFFMSLKSILLAS
ncbi:hypothetical protein H0H92_011403, partial [Tricholoma furcatifolium]